ncbi:MAG: hypothetical protein JW810_05025 [Sedimentisphaerales bacterium]|nr:hypothetical protein [Sedimentisphaerales bacterium]
MLSKSNTQNTLIAFLIATAAIMSGILLLEHLPGRTAYAGDSVRAGSYVATTSRMDTDTDLLWVVNVMSQRLSAYGVDRNGLIRDLGSVDLVAIFQPAGSANFNVTPPAGGTGTPGAGTAPAGQTRPRRPSTTVVP